MNDDLRKRIHRYFMVSKKKSPLCEAGIEKSNPPDHHLSTLSKPHDTKQ